MRFTNALSDVTVRNAKGKDKPYKLADGGGMYLRVMPNGSKYWRYNFRIEGVSKTLAIGVYPAISLKEARIIHEEAVKMVMGGRDPVQAKFAEMGERANRATFCQIAAAWLTELRPRKKLSEKSETRDARNVRYLNAEIGDLDIRELRVRHLTAVLDQFEANGRYETRVRVQGTAIAVMGFACGKGLIDANPFVGVKFAEAYTSPSIARKKRPAIINPRDLGHLLRKIDLYEGRDGNMVGLALKLLALTFARPGDVVAAEWDHIDLVHAKWSIPFETLKMRTQRQKDDVRVDEPYEVPLSRQALALLGQIKRRTGNSRWVFPSGRGQRHLSTNALEDALIAMGYKDVHCPHGFRSSASTLINKERLDKRRRFERELVEIQLDHVDESTRAIYDRDGLWDERCAMMQLWADRLDQWRGDIAPTPQLRPHLRLAS